MSRSIVKALLISAMLVVPMHILAQGQRHSHSHGHAHTAPHGGTLVALGDETVNLEFLLDPADGTLTAFILDSHCENLIRIGEPKIQLNLSGLDRGSTLSLALKPVANVLTGETVSSTAMYQATHAKLKKQKKFDAVIVDVTIRGMRFKNVRFKFPEGN